ncbi:hypothetical protein F2Q70_00033833 [Brassica cretica]|uniref:NAD(P)H dehydrogenase (quinone) n=1 Tax=Brassica cretica TaxID=69181 RepID=A0A8S9JTY5_BRACR|nr:hypothetical protein F2Q70_00033833 [Brassica cretica]
MSEILSSLRSLMASHSPPLDALVVPSEDYHQSEYVSARDKRREFVSGFTGSAGMRSVVASCKLIAITQLVHHGMLFVPIGYTFGAGMFKMDSIRGGSPYGAGVFAGDGSREATETELALAEHQGNYMATIVKRLGQP